MQGLRKNGWVISLSLLIHLIFFLLILISFKTKEIEHEKQPQHYVPSYFYHPTQSSRQITRPSHASTTQARTLAKALPQIKSAPRPAPVPLLEDKETPLPKTKSILALSSQSLQQEQFRQAVAHLSDEKPILLIGDSTKIVDPLVKLIAEALSAHFRYPELLGRLGTKGRVYVAMTIHPEGTFSHIEIVRSSGSQAFDAAALYAVNTAPVAEGVDEFLPKPKAIVVGFIFN